VNLEDQTVDESRTLAAARTQEGAAERRLYTVDQFVQKHPAFSNGGLRWLLFHREKNGLKRAVLRVGRRVLIDETLFFEWLDTCNDTQHAE
jgi:hypothetical protein